MKDEDVLSVVNYSASFCVRCFPIKDRNEHAFQDARQEAMIALWECVCQHADKKIVPEAILGLSIVTMKRGAFRRFFVRYDGNNPSRSKYRYRGDDFYSLDSTIQGTELTLLSAAGPVCDPEDPFKSETLDAVMSELSSYEKKLLHDRFVLDETMEVMAKKRNVTRQAISHRFIKLKPKLKEIVHKYKSPKV